MLVWCGYKIHENSPIHKRTYTNRPVALDLALDPDRVAGFFLRVAGITVLVEQSEFSSSIPVLIYASKNSPHPQLQINSLHNTNDLQEQQSIYDKACSICLATRQ